MTHSQFQKFCTDWNVFKKITNLPDNHIHTQLYNSCDKSGQNCLVNSVTNFFDLHENDLLQQLENNVTKKCNTVIHHLTFSSLHQSETKFIQEFVVCTMIYKIFISKTSSYRVLKEPQTISIY